MLLCTLWNTQFVNKDLDGALNNRRQTEVSLGGYPLPQEFPNLSNLVKLVPVHMLAHKPGPSSVRCRQEVTRAHVLTNPSSRLSPTQYLYFYVFCQTEAPDSFEIITNFPRRTLPCEPTQECPEPPSFAELGLGKTETLFVHDLDA